jgi:hypothetical protein
MGVAKAVKPINQISEKDKLANIKENMAKLKAYREPEQKEMNINDKVNNLKDMDRLR